jgi:hypothetical protein
LQDEYNQKINEVHREYAQGPANVKSPQTYASSLTIFLKQQIGDKESADNEKKANAQVSIEQPRHNRVKPPGKPNGKLAVIAEHENNAHGAPAVKGGKSSGPGH